MSPHFTLPISLAPTLYPRETRDALAKICTPLADNAMWGITGVLLNLSTQHGSTRVGRITEVVRTAPSPRGMDWSLTGFTSLPDQMQHQLALPFMELNTHAVQTHGLRHVLARLELPDQNTIHTQLLLTPTYALLVVDDFQDEVLENEYGDEPRTQEQIEKCLCLILPQAITSDHELLALHPTIQEAKALAHAFSPIPDDQGNPIPLALPNLATLRKDGWV